MRCKEYGLLDLPGVQTRLHLPADQEFRLPESPLVRTLYDCPDVAIGTSGQRCRLVVATHPKGPNKQKIGVERDGVIYELFLTTLPQAAFTEDREQDPDRWCSRSACGQEAWQMVCQWIWNLRLELGHQLAPTTMRTTEFAAAVSQTQEPQGYTSPVIGGSWKAGRFCGQAFTLQPNGTVRCPADKTLFACERRKEQGGSLRMVYAARIGDCRPCPLRQQCQWEGSATKKPRQVSVLLHPLRVGPAPLLWRDWSRREHRRACMQLVRPQRIDVSLSPPTAAFPRPADVMLSRAQRAHFRLSWAERLARNARVPTASLVTITLFGIPESFAASLGLPRA